MLEVMSQADWNHCSWQNVNWGCCQNSVNPQLHKCPFWLVLLKHRGPWCTWWFNHLPGPSIFQKDTYARLFVRIGGLGEPLVLVGGRWATSPNPIQTKLREAEENPLGPRQFGALHRNCPSKEAGSLRQVPDYFEGRSLVWGGSKAHACFLSGSSRTEVLHHLFNPTLGGLRGHLGKGAICWRSPQTCLRTGELSSDFWTFGSLVSRGPAFK